MKKTVTLFIALMALATLKAQTPKVYYPFDGQSLNSNVGSYPLSTVNGSASFTTSTHSGNGTHALSLDGSKYEATSFLFDTNATGLTISFWMKRQPNTFNGVLVSQLDVVQAGGGMTNYFGTFNTYVSPNGYVAMELYSNPQTSSTIFSPDTISFEWTFITFKWNGSMKYVYVNGLPADSSAAPSAINKNSADIDLRIGAVKYYPMGGQPTFLSAYIGDIDEVKLFESALSDAQILNLYNNGTTTGIHQATADLNLNVYPNPAKEFLVISCDEEIETAEVYNVVGQQVIFVKGQITKLNTALLAQGVYTLQLKTAKGNVAVKKFTKQ